MAVPMLWRASQIFRYSDQIIAVANHVVNIDCSQPLQGCSRQIPCAARRCDEVHLESSPPLFATQPFLAIPEQIAAIPCFAVTIRHAAVPLRHLGVLCHDSSSRRLSFALFIRSYPLHCSSFPVAPALCLYEAQRRQHCHNISSPRYSAAVPCIAIHCPCRSNPLRAPAYRSVHLNSLPPQYCSPPLRSASKQLFSDAVQLDSAPSLFCSSTSLP